MHFGSKNPDYTYLMGEATVSSKDKEKDIWSYGDTIFKVVRTSCLSHISCKLHAQESEGSFHVKSLNI